MAIVKVVAPKSGASQKALKNSLQYIFRQEKCQEKYRAVLGPYEYDEISASLVYQSFINEQKLWNKQNGRSYAHYIISWHQDEHITQGQALEFAKEFAEDYFHGHQVAIAVHEDKEHVHTHLIVQSVSYLDGQKLHLTRKDLEYARALSDELCAQKGLSITRKGYHYHGQPLRAGETSTYNMTAKKMLTDNCSKSYVYDCYRTFKRVVGKSKCREDFKEQMMSEGWVVTWEDSKKYISFTDTEGHKVRLARLNKLFNMDIDKQKLEEIFYENQTEELTEEQLAERMSIDVGMTALELGVLSVKAVEKIVKKEQRRIRR